MPHNKKIININRLSKLTQDDTSSEAMIFFENHASLKNKISPSSEIISFSTDSSDAGKDNSDLEKANINMERQLFTRKGNSELPWVFNLFLKTLNYVLSNRLEIILYMIFIAMAGIFISLQIKR